METKGVFERSLQTGPSYVLVLLNVSFPSLRDVCSTYILEPSWCHVLIRNFCVQNGQNITCSKFSLPFQNQDLHDGHCYPSISRGMSSFPDTP